jgi:hypothetical protein
MGRNSFNMHCKKSYVEAEIVPNEVMGPKISEAHYQRCSTARLHLISDKEKDKNCGKDGRFWEPRNKKDLFKFIKKVSQ